MGRCESNQVQTVFAYAHDIAAKEKRWVFMQTMARASLRVHEPLRLFTFTRFSPLLDLHAVPRVRAWECRSRRKLQRIPGSQQRTAAELDSIEFFFVWPEVGCCEPGLSTFDFAGFAFCVYGFNGECAFSVDSMYKHSPAPWTTPISL